MTKKLQWKTDEKTNKKQRMLYRRLQQDSNESDMCRKLITARLNELLRTLEDIEAL